MGLKQEYHAKSKSRPWVCDISREFIHEYIEEMKEEDEITGERYMTDDLAFMIYELASLLD
jgi:hypothetical protein